MDELKRTEEIPNEVEEQLTPEQPKQESEPYVERPRSQRILAWLLLAVVVVGVILWYYWIAKG